MSLIQIENLSKAFVSGFRIRHLFSAKARKSLIRIEALRNLNLSIQEGEFFGLMGPNGSGKTTLLKILANLILPDQGTVQIGGAIGLVSGDERSFYWRLTGRQNLEFFASLCQLAPKEGKKRIAKLCEDLEILNPNRPFQEYSTGLKQRFALARSLLHDPPILLLDEPTRGLDKKSAEGFRARIQQLVQREKKTVIYATHLVEEASTLFDRAGILNQGRLESLC